MPDDNSRAYSIVEAVYTINFEGNIIPFSWYSSSLLKTEKNCTNLNAIVILSDIVYWYRPTVTRDEETGDVIKLEKKFSGDMLKVDYGRWAARFGLTRRQVRDAITFLRAKGIIRQELRTITTQGDKKLGNVPHVEPVFSKLKEISEFNDPITFKRDSLSRSSGRPSHVKTVDPLTFKRETLHEINHETSKENTHTTHSAGARARVTSDIPQSGGQGSRFSLEECRRYAEHLKQSGQGINNPGGYGTILFRSGEADSLIEAFLNAPAQVDVKKCPDCKGEGFIYLDPANFDKGVKPCRHKSLQAGAQ